MTASMMAATVHNRAMTSVCYVHRGSPAHVTSVAARAVEYGYPVMACRASKPGWARYMLNSTSVPGVCIDARRVHQ